MALKRFSFDDISKPGDSGKKTKHDDDSKEVSKENRLKELKARIAAREQLIKELQQNVADAESEHMLRETAIEYLELGIKSVDEGVQKYDLNPALDTAFVLNTLPSKK